MTEKEIQNYIWEHKEEFEKFLQPIEFPEKPVKSPWEYSPTEILYYHIIDKYYKNKVVRYDGYVLDKICATLNCDIGDILTHETEKEPE